GEVAFCSGLQGWGFTLRDFARFYLKKFKMENRPDGEIQVARLLWSSKVSYSSDDCFDPEGSLVKAPSQDRSFFIVFVLRPIYKVMEWCKEGKIEEIKEYLKNYDVDFTGIELKGEGKNLFKVVMRTWLSAADTILSQIIIQLPSPVESQQYRAKLLYTGGEDECYHAIRNADSSEQSPLMVYISKMAPMGENRFVGVGRIFSGCISAGMKVRVQGPDYVPGSKDDLHIKTIQGVVVMMGRNNKDITTGKAGNIVGIIGIDSALKKTGTVTTSENAHNIKNMKFSVSPVVKYAVKPKNLTDLPKLKEGLKRLAKSDPLCQVSFTDNGEFTIAGAGELHLEICINDLKNEYAGIEIEIDEPMVNYMEGIRAEETETKMAKSANKHNRLFMSIQSLSEEIIENIDNGKLVSKDPKERSQKFKDVLDINEDWVKKIMFYAPLDVGPNIMVDATKGVAHLHEIKDHLRAAFEKFTISGPLIGEQVKGIQLNLNDVTLHADAIHRTSPQIFPPAIQVATGLFLLADPILYEPIFKIEVSVPNDHIGTVNGVLASKRGMMTNLTEEGSFRSVITGTLPVKESFGF
ncbi:hypothetical protein H311_03325, partial [Anncaliia algerae PRA109]